MFDPTGEALTGQQLAGLISANHTALVEHEDQVLLLAAAWADVHDLDPAGQDYQPLIERACAWGGDGTPAVSEYCAVELGALQGTGMVAARMLIGDALDLRHRLPRLWRHVRAGQVRAWQARKVAQATHQLSWEAAHEVDDCVSGYLGMLPWPRFQRVLAAAILAADPVGAAQREQRARTERDVYAFDGEDGLKTLIAKAGSGDIIWFMATVNRIADILHLDGDPDPVGARRAKAIAILAQPARALQLLIDHTGDPDRAPAPAAPHSDQAGAQAGQSAPGNPDIPDPDPDPDIPDPDGPETEAAVPEAAVPEPAVPEPTDGPPEHGRRDDHEPAPDQPASDGPDDGGPVPDEEPPTSGGQAGPDAGRRNGLDLTRPELPLDPAAARPRVVLHFHLSDTALHAGHGLVRPEHGTAISLRQLHDFLTDTGCQIRIQPVLDPHDQAPIDAYEAPLRLRDALLIRNPADVFPYGTCTSRSIDLDHTVPYLPPERDGPPGQTGMHNLGPTARTGHRAVTHTCWRRRQPDPGTYLFRSPHGWIYLVTNHGTLNLGRTPYAHTVWHQAAPSLYEVDRREADQDSPAHSP